MSLARSLERRLERLFEGATGRVFSGRLHPSEMAGRIAREADLARYRHESGPATANRYVLTVSPEDGRRLLEDRPIDARLSVIGEVVEPGTREIILPDGSRAPLPRGGWQHRF